MSSTENLSTLSAQHARREDESVVDAEVAKIMLKEGEPSKTRSPEIKSRPGTPMFRPSRNSPKRSPSPIDEMDEIYYSRPNPSAPHHQEHTIFVPGIGNMIPVPKYNAKDIGKWIEKYEYVGYSNNWSKEDMFKRLYTAFDGTPHAEYFIRLMKKLNADGSRYIHSWDTAKRAFRKRKPENETLINAETIYSIKQKPDEDVADYITKKENLLTEIKPSLPEEFIVSQIVQGLRTELYDRIMNSSIEEPIKTVDELINRAIPIEQLVRSIKQRDPHYNQKKPNKKVDFTNESFDDNPEGDKEQEVNKQLKDIKRMLVNINNNPGRNRFQRNNWQHTNFTPQRQVNPNPPRQTNYYNQRQNNYNPQNQSSDNSVPAIPAPQPPSQLAIEAGPRARSRTNITRDIDGRPLCFNCQKFGHLARDCRSARQSRRSLTPTNVQGNEQVGTH